MAATTLALLLDAGLHACARRQRHLLQHCWLRLVRQLELRLRRPAAVALLLRARAAAKAGARMGEGALGCGRSGLRQQLWGHARCLNAAPAQPQCKARSLNAPWIRCVIMAVRMEAHAVKRTKMHFWSDSLEGCCPLPLHPMPLASCVRCGLRPGRLFASCRSGSGCAEGDLVDPTLRTDGGAAASARGESERAGEVTIWGLWALLGAQTPPKTGRPALC